MRLTYREDRATQVAARLLERAGGRLNHMKLVKLVYLADREALVRWGRPITFDTYYSLPHGPVPSFTLDRINAEAPPGGESYWHRFVSERDRHEVSLLESPGTDQLAPAEEQLIDEIYERFGGLDQWQLRDHTHTLPEWMDPHGSSVPIELRDILLGEGFSDEAVEEIEETLAAEQAATRAFGG